MTAQNIFINMSHSGIAHTIHGNNKEKGFWPEDSGERNFAEVIALIHSEVDEAYEASIDDAFDDKLPEYKGVEVELVDTIIRLYDVIGAHVIYIDELMSYSFTSRLEYLEDMRYSSLETHTSLIHLMLSQTLDAHRKDIVAEAELLDASFAGTFPNTVTCPLYHILLCQTLVACQSICEHYGIDWMHLMGLKVSFNKARPHKHGAKY